MASGRVQVGQIVSGGLGTPGIAWGSIVAPPTVGSVTVYSGVTRFQSYYNSVYDKVAASSLAFKLTGGHIAVDGKYGEQTHTAVKKYVTLYTRLEMCSGTSAAEVESGGPQNARACLATAWDFSLRGMNDSEIAQMQAAWSEWKSTVQSYTPPAPLPTQTDAERRAACEATGGTWDSATQTCIPSGMEEKGLSAGWWIVLALLGAAVGYGIYWYATEK